MGALAEQVVIVTGASSGIGEACVRRLAAAGARVVATARRADRLALLAGDRVATVPADVTSDADRRRIVEVALARFGRIDALVNNAGFGQRGPVELVPLEAWRRNYEVNVFAVVALTQLALPHLRAAGAGSRPRIVNIGSVAGRIARPLSSVYDSTKHALEAVSDGLRGELRPFGIEVVVVRPGWIATEFAGAAESASADALADAGPYAPYLRAWRLGTRKLHRLAAAPDDVAQVVERALTARRPRAHYAVPGHAKVFLFLRWLLPGRVFDRLVAMRREKPGRG